MKIVEESIWVQASAEDIFRLYADIEMWVRVLPDVLEVVSLYDDGEKQEFLMTVERPNGPETVRTIRLCKPYSAIEMFQPVPPPGLHSMSGVWTFEQDGEQTLLKATRKFQLLESTFSELSREEAHERFADKLRGFLRINIECFKNAAENHTAKPDLIDQN